jgi:hypothetical protein
MHTGQFTAELETQDVDKKEQSLSPQQSVTRSCLDHEEHLDISHGGREVTNFSYKFTFKLFKTIFTDRLTVLGENRSKTIVIISKYIVYI